MYQIQCRVNYATVYTLSEEVSIFISIFLTEGSEIQIILVNQSKVSELSN